MSFIQGLFNRKKQLKDTRYPLKDSFTDLEEEDPEEEASEQESKGIQASEADPYDPNMEYEVVEREIQPAKIICPDCGGITLEGLEFCDKCGGELL